MRRFVGNHICSLCGQPGQCFSLNSAIIRELSEEERQDKVGCYDCLRRDRFGFMHGTDIGIITEDGLLTFDEPDDEPKRVFVVADDGGAVADKMPLIGPPRSQIFDEAIAELHRTPSVSTWQDFSWPIHHNDFMAYVGRWEPEDFSRMASGGMGRELLLEIAGPMFDHFWPENEEANFRDNFIVFECLHCPVKTALFDMD